MKKNYYLIAYAGNCGDLQLPAEAGAKVAACHVYSRGACIDADRPVKLATKQSPKSAQAWISLGEALIEAQRYAETVDSHEKALALKLKNMNILVDQVTCYHAVDRYDRAVEQH